MSWGKWVGMLIPVLVFILYLPGLGSTFLLDDFHILQPMAFSGGIKDVHSLLTYLESGGGGPLGRPISLLSFVFNAQNWPADPKSFLITNILIHSLNALCVFFLVLKMGRICGDKNKEGFLGFALSVSAIWALHPFHVSSVLYIVQRMTLLSSFFSFFVFLSYINFREAIISNRVGRALCMLIVCSGCAVLAVLSKENALLIPIFLLLIESVLRWRGASTSHHVDRFYRMILIPSALVVFLYPLKLIFADVVVFLSEGEIPLHGRPFSMLERFLTQGRVILDYISDILMPKMQSPGVFHDQYLISKSLFQPLSTLFCLGGHVLVMLAAFRWRKSVPWISFGILWFYAGHLLESTVVMLEIKFEHRNYLPSLGLVIAFVSLINQIKFFSRKKTLIVLIVSIVCSVFLWFGASLWGRPYQAALVWSHENPKSPRALEEIARRSLVYMGDVPSAKHYMGELIKVSPLAVNELKYILAFCETYDNEQPRWSDYAARIQVEPRDWSLVAVINDLLKVRMRGECSMLPYEALLLLVDGFRKNRVYWGDPSSLLINETEYEAAAFFRDDVKIAALEYAIDLDKTHLWQATARAGILATHGYLDLAAERLKEAIKLAANGGVRAEDRAMKDAIEILGVIEREREK